MARDGFAEGTRRAVEIIDERLEYLENYTPRDKSHEQRLSERAGELETVKRLIQNEVQSS